MRVKDEKFCRRFLCIRAEHKISQNTESHEKQWERGGEEWWVEIKNFSSAFCHEYWNISTGMLLHEINQNRTCDTSKKKLYLMRKSKLHRHHPPISSWMWRILISFLVSNWDFNVCRRLECLEIYRCCRMTREFKLEICHKWNLLFCSHFHSLASAPWSLL